MTRKDHMLRVFSICLIVLTVAIFYHCDITTPDISYTEINIMDDSLCARVDSLVEPFLDQYSYLVTAVIQDGEIALTRSYGKNRLNTLEQYASVSKPVTATMAMVMYKDGLIDRLMDPIADYDQKYIDTQPDAYASPSISFFHLLTHSSGIVHLDPLWRNGKLNMLFSPGSDVEYSTKAFGVLGDVLETISGNSFQTLLTDLIETPVGGSSFWCYPLVQTTPGAGVFSTIGDMALFVQGIMNETYYSEEFLQDTVLVPYAQTSSGNVGLGWFVLEHEGRYLGYHAGSNGRPRAFVLFDPLNKHAVMFMGKNKVSNAVTDLHILALDVLLLLPSH